MVRPSDDWEVYRQWRQSEASRSLALAVIRFDELCAVAISLFPTGKSCHIDSSKYAFGGENIAFEVNFQSGEVWIARLRYPHDDIHDENNVVLESEAVTMSFLSANTTLPVPKVYGYDSRHGNPVGLPYILMQAMPGKRLWGGTRKDYIPDEHKDKVYHQIADIYLQLYAHPFDTIGMLHDASEMDLMVKVGPIFDESYRIKPYGPYRTAIDFYRNRAMLLNEYRQDTLNATLDAGDEHVLGNEYEPEAAQFIVDSQTNNGPFYLSHPDLTINNFLFDNDYNITALLDWSRCQTVPIESFAKIPEKLVPEADTFLDAYNFSDELRAEWKLRRKRFLDILRRSELQKFGTSDIADAIESPRSYFANCLDMCGILGIDRWLPRKEFEMFTKFC
jgi:Phosphotransferase enzyme family